MQALKEEKRAL